MKSVFTITILTLIGQVLLAQDQSTWMDIDTIEQFPNKTLVEYKTYSDSSLMEQAKAFLFPIVQKWPKYRLLGNLFTTEVNLDSIVFHGDKTTYLDTREYKTDIFDNGKLISTNYFDSKGVQISKQEFTNLNNLRGPCGFIKGNYLYQGKK